jgi:hypothetical protein
VKDPSEVGVPSKLTKRAVSNACRHVSVHRLLSAPTSINVYHPTIKNRFCAIWAIRRHVNTAVAVAAAPYLLFLRLLCMSRVRLASNSKQVQASTL